MELILILVIALIIFGPKKLPEIGKAIGDAFKAFKKTQEDVTKEADNVVSQLLLALPLFVLFEVSIVLASFVEKKSKAKVQEAA
ncbi:MAG: hypothetical protein SAMD01599839_03480 [Rectinema sp.]